MKIKTALLGFTIAGVTALSASCSGSSESNDSSGGKSSTSTAGKSASTAGASSAGASAGGASANGGASNNGGTKSNDAGTTNNGGITNNGGNANAAGTSNFGGAGFDPADYMCDPVPTKGSACTPGTQPCTDGTAVCYCQMMKWACLDLGAAGAGPGSGFGGLDCPATKPMNGGVCGDAVGICPYGQGGCACYNGMWACR